MFNLFDKRPYLYGAVSVVWLLGITLFLASCSVKPQTLSIEEQMIQIEKDLESISAEKTPLTKSLTLYDAMARAVKYNFEQRLAAYEINIKRKDIDVERLNLLPDLNIGYSNLYRSNDVEVTLPSSATGLQALQTVDFDDRTKNVANLELSWNILDFGLSYARAKQHADEFLIAKERRRKILQGLIEETRIAYFKAAAADQILKQVDKLIGEAQYNLKKARHIEEIGLQAPVEILDYQSSLLETVRSLITRRKVLTTARLELAHLANLKDVEAYKLDVGNFHLDKDAPILTMDGEALEIFALMNRPELREEFYNHRMAARDVRKEIVSTLPGLGFSVGGNYDSNSVLENTQFLTLATGFAGNLIRLFTLEDRTQKAESKERLADLRRRATVAAVLSQVKMGYTRFDVAQNDYQIFRDLEKVNKRLLDKTKKALDKGDISHADYLDAKARHLINRIEQNFAYIDVHAEYARLVSTLGMDVLPVNYGEIETDELATQIETQFKSLDYQTIDKLVVAMKDQTKASIEKKKQEKVAKKKALLKSPYDDQLKIETITKDLEFLGFEEEIKEEEKDKETEK